jgi:AAA family ATP:ADP antiporter
MKAFFRKLLSPVVELRDTELATALMMFAYSFLVMTSYTALKPVTRSQFIKDLGADNLPLVQFAFGIMIGFIMQGYAAIVGRMPRRWALPMTLGGLVGLLVVFWLWFQSGSQWASTGFYFFGLILGILVISQFWTLANEVYDPRQAKRLFGFIGGGASLGGIAGSSLSLQATTIGTTNLLLVSAALMTVCLVLVVAIIKRERPIIKGSLTGGEDEGVSSSEALKLLRDSKHLQTIALIIAFAAIGAAIVEQQLNMATEAAKGQGNTDSITSFLGEVQLYTSIIGFVIQVWLVSKIQRYLGIGFALLILPISLGLTGSFMLINGALLAPMIARVIDTSLRYTVDKTTREILFLPLPTDVKLQAKPFIDVTVDRLAKGVGALGLLVLIQPWGLGLTWQQLSYASLTLVAVWLVAAVYAKREYVRAFRRSIEQQRVRPSEIRLDAADLNTVEALIVELGHEDPQRVVYAIDLLESLDKRHLVSPLLLNHKSPVVRRRTLLAAANAAAEGAAQWAGGAEQALKDPDPDVRLAAVRAMAAIRSEHAAELMRPFLRDADPRLAVTAAVALVAGGSEQDRGDAEEALRALSSDPREQMREARLEVARALGRLHDARFRALLVPLMYDADLDVAREAIHSAGTSGPGDIVLVPPLISLMRNRRLKRFAREVLVGYGEDVVDTLAYFLNDQDEDKWIRRHVPSTLALIPSQRALDALVGALEHEDGFVRYKAVAGVERLRSARPDLSVDPAVIERQILREAGRAFNALTLRYNLFDAGRLDADALLARALSEKRERAVNRIFHLLALIHSPDDVAAVRTALTRADGRARSGAIEYLDNLLKGEVRRRVVLLLDEMPASERVQRGNTIFKTRVRDLEDTLAQLVHDDEQTISAAAIQVIERREIWALADDLEHVLAHRDPRDWAVFEASSWALAARRMSTERRRALWLEPLPAVELADRLRRLPLFTFVSVDELFRIAALGRQVRYESGQVLHEDGKPPALLQVLLDGRVVIEETTPRTIDAPAVLAFDNVLEGTPVDATIRATGTAICLSLSSEEFLSLLSENVEIAQGIFRLLIETGGRPAIIHGRAPAALRQPAADRMQPLDLVRLFQSSPLLSRATTGQLLALTKIARPITIKPGVDPLAESASSMIVMLSGSVRVEQDGQPAERANGGDIVGMATTLGGLPASIRVEGIAEGGAVGFTRTELFDLLADHIDLLQGIYSSLLRSLSPPVETL